MAGPAIFETPGDKAGMPEQDGVSVSVVIRTAADADSEAVIAVIEACWTACAGVVFDADAEMPELRNFASHYDGLEGRAWVAELDGRVVACAAVVPADTDGAWMLHKLNVLPAARRNGIARALVREAESLARAHDAARMVLWSDTRFGESHALYRQLGYERMPRTRSLDDLSKSVEYRFRKSL